MQQHRQNKSKRNRTKERLYDRAILATLQYRAVFNASLSFHQLATYLLTEHPVDYHTYKSRLRALMQAKKIDQHRGKYFITGIKPLSWYSRGEAATSHLGASEETFRLLGKIRWIKLLAVTGSVAAHNASKDDDIDIFIVTEKHRLWITRFFVVLILKTLNMYRTEKSSAGKVCPNIFVDAGAMAWPTDKRNVYIAHEILMMVPVIDRDETYFKFIKQNEWVFRFMSNFYVHPPASVQASPQFNSPVLKLIDRGLMHLQQLYMHRKKTTEVTHVSFIHFNKADHSVHVLQKFEKYSSRR